jgi:hypothetical protein
MHNMKDLCFIVGAVAILTLSGCVSTTRIEAEDNRVFLPSVRGSVNLTQGKEAPSEPQNGHAIEFEAFRARGSDSQSLAAGQSPVILGGTTFSAPRQLQNDFDFHFADVSWRWRKFFGGRSVGLETLAGLGYAGLDLSVSSPTQQASQHFSNWGPQGGVGVIWRMQPGTSLQARIAAFASSRDGVNQAAWAEVFLVKTLGRNVTARAGYAGWEVKGQTLSNNSDFRLRFSGPALGLQIDFGR